MKIGIDTNILVYAAGFDDPVKQARCIEIFASLPADRVVGPLQVCGELHFVLSRKSRNRSLASDYLSRIIQRFGVVGMSATSLMDGVQLVESHQFQIFDALILAQCAASGCSCLLSEDLHDGFEWKGCTVLNPLAAQPHPMLTMIAGHTHS